LAKLTGGRVYEASKDLRYLQACFSQIAEELRYQYSLGYYPTRQAKANERRRIKVRVERPGLAVRNRDSYIYKPVPGAGPGTVRDQSQTPKGVPVPRQK
jgi:VWFA-related protein